MFAFSYITTAGSVKKINQDALMIKTARYGNNEILFSAVCDGIGGLSGGENASSFVIRGVSEWFEKKYPVLLNEKKGVLDIRQSLDNFLHCLNDDINDSCLENDVSMGTTFTGLLIDCEKEIMLTAHAGDSRLYKIYSDSIEIVTSDHSIVAEEVRRGIITEESAKTDKRRNQITNCIGAKEKDRFYDYIIQEPDKNCIYMLCSDGFCKMVEKHELHQILRPENNPDSQAINLSLQKLLKLNLERKESDNITAVAIRYIKENGGR